MLQIHLSENIQLLRNKDSDDNRLVHLLVSMGWLLENEVQLKGFVDAMLAKPSGTYNCILVKILRNEEMYKKTARLFL